jgi:hypothetical protein
MRRTAALLVVVVALAGCADAPAPDAARRESQLDERRLGIYESLIRELVAQEDLGPGSTWDRVVIVSRICENAGEPEEPAGCDDAFTSTEQQDLVRRLEGLGARVEFLADPSPLYDDAWLDGSSGTIVARVGMIRPDGDGVQVGGSYGCGGRCGSGTTYRLQPRGDGWEVVGTVGSAWIS